MYSSILYVFIRWSTKDFRTSWFFVDFDKLSIFDALWIYIELWRTLMGFFAFYLCIQSIKPAVTISWKYKIFLSDIRVAFTKQHTTQYICARILNTSLNRAPSVAAVWCFVNAIRISDKNILYFQEILTPELSSFFVYPCWYLHARSNTYISSTVCLSFYLTKK